MKKVGGVVVNKAFVFLKTVGFKTPIARLTKKETTKIASVGMKKMSLISYLSTNCNQVQNWMTSIGL